jgi:hypothetical protein
MIIKTDVSLRNMYILYKKLEHYGVRPLDVDHYFLDFSIGKTNED